MKIERVNILIEDKQVTRWAVSIPEDWRRIDKIYDHAHCDSIVEYVLSEHIEKILLTHFKNMPEIIVNSDRVICSNALAEFVVELQGWTNSIRYQLNILNNGDFEDEIALIDPTAIIMLHDTSVVVKTLGDNTLIAIRYPDCRTQYNQRTSMMSMITLRLKILDEFD